MQRQTRQDSNPDLRGWSSSCSLYTTGLRSGRPESNGRLRSGGPVLFPLSYIRVEHARLESNQRPLPSQDSARSAELRAHEEEPPAGVEPAPRPYDGRVLAVDTTEARSGDGRSRTDTSRVASAALCPVELHPRGVAGRRRCSASAATGRPTGFEPVPRGSRPRMLPLHHSHHERGRPDSNRRPFA